MRCMQVLCSVINSSYDSSVCSCDEQLSVFDTCVSKYPCLQIYVSYSAHVTTDANETDHGSHSASSDLPHSAAHVADSSGVSSGRNRHRYGDDNSETQPADSRLQREAQWQQPNDLIITTSDSSHLATTAAIKSSVVLGNDHLRSPTGFSPPIEIGSTSDDGLLITVDYEVREESLKSAAVSLLSSSMVQHTASFSVGDGDGDGDNDGSTSEAMSSIAEGMSTPTVAALDVSHRHSLHGDEERAPSTVHLRPDTATSSQPDWLLSSPADDRSGVTVTAASATEDLRSAKLYRSWDDSFHHEVSNAIG